MRRGNRHTFSVLAVAVLLVLGGCRYDTLEPVAPSADVPYSIDIPSHFPPIDYPPDNQPNAERVALGKQLFFDPRLSADGMVSCASCHLPEKAFADPAVVSTGVFGRQGFRNSPTLANLAWQERFFMDGGVPTLELQVLAPFDNHDEMDLHILDVVAQLSDDESLQAASRAAYQRELDPFVITRAISAFERTLISANSPYDRYLQGETNALSQDAQAGMELFFSEEIACGTCHSGHLLTDLSFQNIGLYEVYSDEGRARVTGDPDDIGKFKVPSLRNVAHTAPYMHDGSLPDLLSVIEHFNSGGYDHPLKHPAVKPLNLSNTEKQQLLVFLESLSDEEFLSNSEHRP